MRKHIKIFGFGSSGSWNSNHNISVSWFYGCNISRSWYNCGFSSGHIYVPWSISWKQYSTCSWVR